MGRLMTPRPRLGWILALVVAAAILALIVVTAQRPNVYLVSGDSMTPTLHDGERIEIQVAPKPQRDDIVIFTQQEQWPKYTPDKHDRLVIKRIIGVPGDTVSLEDRVLTINGNSIYKLPTEYDCDTESFNAKVPASGLFVLGDNTANSRDSLRALCLGADDPYAHISDAQTWGQYEDSSFLSRLTKTIGKDANS